MGENEITVKGTNLTEEMLFKIIDLNRDKAEETLKDPDKTEQLLQDIENKLRDIPAVGEVIADVAVLVSLVRCYVKGEYKRLPFGSMLSIVAALIYFLTPIDILPDTIPGIGLIDDAAVIGFCMKSLSSDIKPYIEWREKNNKVYNFD